MCSINSGQNASINFAVTSKISYLEHVVVVFSMQFLALKETDYLRKSPPPGRGTVRVRLTSPSGTTSTLLPLRPGDVFPGSYSSWPLMSLHFWAESPAGTWQLLVENTGSSGGIEVLLPRVRLYGTSKVPVAVSRIPSACSSACDASRGCAAKGAWFCDACARLRLASNLACVSSCPQGLMQQNGYCYDDTEQEVVCTAPVPTRVPPSYSPTHTTTRTTAWSSTFVPMETGTAEPTAAPKSSSATPTTEIAVLLLLVLTSAVTRYNLM